MSRHAETIRWAFAEGFRVAPDGTCLAPSGAPRKPYFAPKKPYALITVRRGSIHDHFFVHKLAAFQLYGESALATGVHVRHLDGNSRNNAHANLALGTAKENAADKPLEVRSRSVVAAALTNRKLTDAQVESVVRRYWHGEDGAALAREFGLRKSTMSYIVNGKTYKHVTAKLVPIMRAQAEQIRELNEYRMRVASGRAA